MRSLCLTLAFIFCLMAAACAQSSNPALKQDVSEPDEPLAIQVRDASGNPVPGVRIEPSWTSGTVTAEGQPAVIASGQGELILRLEGGEVAALPWNLPVGTADVDITLYPVTAKAGKRLDLTLPVQMGTGYTWHPLRPDSGCTQGTLEKRRGDAPNLVGGSGTQQFLCPGKKAGGLAEGFILARATKTVEGRYPTSENDRRLYQIAVFLISVR